MIQTINFYSDEVVLQKTQIHICSAFKKTQRKPLRFEVME